MINEIRVLGKESGTEVQKTPEVQVPKFEGSKYDVQITTQDTIDEVKGIIERRIGAQYKDWFSLEVADGANGYDYFELSQKMGKFTSKE